MAMGTESLKHLWMVRRDFLEVTRKACLRSEAAARDNQVKSGKIGDIMYMRVCLKAY